MGEGGREGVEGVVEIVPEREVSERVREGVDGLVESRAESEVGEGEGGFAEGTLAPPQ